MRRTLTFVTTALFVLSLAASADASSCKDAKGKYVKCPAPAAAASTAAKPASATTGSMSSGSGPNCKKGKRCGNACISVNDTCHK